MLHKLPSPLVAVVLLLSAAASLPSFGQTLRIAMTASDIPTTTGIPNNGGEGFRFLGFPAFDGLINWDFTRPDQIAGLTPGLAASWKIDDSDHTRWVFLLRDGVAFHDGSAVTADAMIWNLDAFTTRNRRNSMRRPRRSCARSSICSTAIRRSTTARSRSTRSRRSASSPTWSRPC